MFTLSVPSYVIPGTYLENIRFIDRLDAIGNIELLFFSFDDETKVLLEQEIAGIGSFAERFSFSVHMPDALDDSHSVLLDMLKPIAQRFVVHAPSADRESFAERLTRWTADYGDVFCIENVAGRDYLEAAMMLENISICCDTGHLLLDGENPLDFIDRFGDRIEEIHLHTVAEGKDHHPLRGDEPWFGDILPYLNRFDGTVHMEIFNYEKLCPMIDLLVENRQQANNEEYNNDRE
jgi:hypothetical protein